MINQTFKNFEHIIVDDGSTDNCAKLIMDYLNQAQFPVIFIKKTNGGKHTGTNIAWKLASGKYVVNLDSDDELLPHALQFMVGMWSELPKEQRDNYWCVQARCANQINNEMVGQPYPENINRLPEKKLKKVIAKVKGDKIGMQRLDILKNNLYPEMEGINFVTENLIWQKLEARYKTYYSNEIVRIYYINEGDCLSGQRRTMQTVKNQLFISHFKLNNRHDYDFSPKYYLLLMFKFSIYFFLADAKFKKTLFKGGVVKFDDLLNRLTYCILKPLAYFSTYIYKQKMN